MKFRNLFMGALAVASASAMAAPLSPEAALQRARGEGSFLRKAQSAPSLVYTSKDKAGIATSYVFSNGADNGFQILSADDAGVAVLGYSDSGSFDPNNIPPQLEWLLSEYGRQIERNKAQGVSASSYDYAISNAEPIAPLLTTLWDQGAPYNDMCPSMNSAGDLAPTGCVATSFAQVMNYFKYPEVGQGTISYKSGSKRLSMNFARDPFDWDNMLDEYTNSATEIQKNAVALLMKSCGYAVEMGYGLYASGAQSYKLANAAVQYFKYDGNISYHDRLYYSYPQWATMIYENLRDCGPVICDGRSIDGGHSFVCDGYDGNGYFHFNWGWGGMSNGYYILDSLNPEAQGTGGADGGFNFGQSALFGMQPPTGAPIVEKYDNIKIYGTAIATLSGNDINFQATGDTQPGWANGSYRPISVRIGGKIENITDPSQAPIIASGSMASGSATMETTTMTVTSYYPTTSANPRVNLPANLTDGDYKVTIMAQQTTVDDAPWQEVLVPYGNANYCWLNVSGGTYTVTSEAAKQLDFATCEITSPLYSGRNARLKVVVTNPSEMTLTTAFSPMLYKNGQKMYEGDMMLVTVAPGQTVERETLVAFYSVDGGGGLGEGYELQLLNRQTGTNIGTYGTYEMGSTSAGFTLKVEEFGIPTWPQMDIVRRSRTFKNCYLIDNPADFDINLIYKVSKGYFDSSIRMVASEYNEVTNKFVADDSNLYYDTPFLGTGQSQDLTLPMDFSTRDIWSVYMVRVACMNGGNNQSLGSIYLAFKENSAVEGIIAEEEGNVEYFTLQGVKVAEPQAGQLLIRKTGAKTEKVIIGK